MPPPQKFFWFWLSKWWAYVHSEWYILGFRCLFYTQKPVFQGFWNLLFHALTLRRNFLFLALKMVNLLWCILAFCISKSRFPALDSTDFCTSKVRTWASEGGMAPLPPPLCIRHWVWGNPLYLHLPLLCYLNILTLYDYNTLSNGKSLEGHCPPFIKVGGGNCPCCPPGSRAPVPKFYDQGARWIIQITTLKCANKCITTNA